MDGAKIRGLIGGYDSTIMQAGLPWGGLKAEGGFQGLPRLVLGYEGWKRVEGTLPPLRPKDEPRNLYRMTAPTHIGYAEFPGIEMIYRLGFKEVNTGFRPTLELIEIGSAPRQDADTWTYHPCIPETIIAYRSGA